MINLIKIHNTINETKNFSDNYLKNIDTTLNNFKEFYEKNVFIEFSEKEQGIKNIISNYKLFKEQYNFENTSNSYDYNIFNIFIANRPEEQIHTPFLKSLLDCNGFHGQKDLFYKLFLDVIIQKNEKISRFLNEENNEYLVQSEVYVKNSKTERGRIDILIKSLNKNKKFAIIIENKWNSGDSCYDQIQKYRKNLIEKQKFEPKNVLVFYLTKIGLNPKLISDKDFDKYLILKENENFFAISYKIHINKWLRLSLEKCKSKKINSILTQYLNYINL